ncbi:MAG: transposase [Thermodesulfobacteriota bacterium]
MASFQSTRRNLPHWQQPGSTYFLTWRVKGDQHLSPQERSMVLETLLYWQEVKWTVYAAVVMPNHVHVLAQPLTLTEGQAINLSQIIHSVKTYSARTINGQRGEPGSLWQDERHDRIVRNEGEFLEKWQYIRNNAVVKGLAATPEEYPWLYEKG